MSGAIAVLRREFSAALDAPSAWVATATFAVALRRCSSSRAIRSATCNQPGLWEGRVASLHVVFAWLPPMYAILAPALTMGSWAEERRAGTEELLLAWPIRTFDVVLGKFLSAWALLLVVTLVAIAPAVVVVANLGPLDLGTVLGGAIGTALLGAACVAVGLLVSSATREQLVAFLVSALVLAGLWSVSLFIRVIPASFAEWAYLLSPQAHFVDSAARGVFALADVVYFGTLSGLALLVTWRTVEARRRG
ncbi:MAG: ABC transporter permease [Planctomycetota bacterium]